MLGSGRSAPAAFVVLQTCASVTADMLKHHVRDQLANYKVPREIVVFDELPAPPPARSPARS